MRPVRETTGDGRNRLPKMSHEGSRLTTIGDVAHAAGVSHQTVSNVLNAPERVAESTKERVHDAIARLNYRPNASAKRLRTGRPATVAIRFDANWDEGTGSLLDRFIHATIDEVSARGMRALAYTADQPDRELRTIRELLEARDADWFIVTSTFPGDPRVSWMIEHEIPCVLFGRPWMPDGTVSAAPVLWVDVDGRQGTYDATRSFLDAGMTRIGYLDWTYSSGMGVDRRSGWEAAMVERGGLGAETLSTLVQACPDDAEHATAAVRELLRRVPELEALVCASDTLAVGAMKAAADERMAGLRVAGFDNSRTAALLGFSSVDQNLARVASLCLDLLAARAEGRGGPSNALVHPSFVDRAQPYTLTASGR